MHTKSWFAAAAARIDRTDSTFDRMFALATPRGIAIRVWRVAFLDAASASRNPLLLVAPRAQHAVAQIDDAAAVREAHHVDAFDRRLVHFREIDCHRAGELS